MIGVDLCDIPFRQLPVGRPATEGAGRAVSGYAGRAVSGFSSKLRHSLSVSHGVFVIDFVAFVYPDVDIHCLTSSTVLIGLPHVLNCPYRSASRPQHSLSICLASLAVLIDLPHVLNGPYRSASRPQQSLSLSVDVKQH